ncbi:MULTISPECIES: hypothetical protein [unclassified Streptomyces]|uniref:hypothetical protein n=1 Tax=unclassified Streptomyces TaxID=2593676 RepID=UPI001BB0CE59|nr:hypothetical protein [Streptomyces sp. V17-9]QUW89941.1 hypothetical protein KE639_01117 [Streptomyces sp. V17-9]
MTVEVRLPTADRLEEVLRLPVDAVSIGQEGCAAKLPARDTLRQAVDRITATGRRAGLVLPAAWERTGAQLVDLAADLARRVPLALTVNDLGTAAALAGSGRELAAGLALMPGRPHDAAQAPRRPLQPPVFEDAYLQELEGFGIRTLEADAAADVPDRPGWQVRRLIDVAPLAWARSCPTARHHQLAPPHCADACDEPIDMVATHRWQLGHGHREPIPVADRPAQVPLIVYGNAVYATTPTAHAGDNYVIIDARFYRPDALAERLATVRPSVSAASL